MASLKSTHQTITKKARKQSFDRMIDREPERRQQMIYI